MPGVTIKNESEKRVSCGLASLLSACQAISIPITTVLPLPVAIFSETRKRPGLASPAKRCSSLAIQPSPISRRHALPATTAPEPNLLAHLIDKPVLLDPVASPLGVEVQLRALLRRRDR